MTNSYGKMETKNCSYVHTDFTPNVTWEKPESNYVLNRDEIHVWKIKVPEKFYKLFKEHRTVLKKYELIKANRFYWEKDFQSYLTGRIALRILLAKYLNIPAAEIEFDLSVNKPSIIPGNNVKYNLSYSGKYILISTGLVETGVDVEKVDSRLNYIDLLKSCFTPKETDFIQKDSKTCGRSFFVQWTRKEALLKYTGQGIVDDLTAIPSLDGNHAVSSDNLFLRENIKLTSFMVDSTCVASLVCPILVTKINFLEWA